MVNVKNIILLGDRLLVSVESTKKTTESGIVLPDSSVSKSQIGTVIAVGEGRVAFNGEKIPMTIKENDRIVFDKFAGTELQIEDETYLVLNEQNVIAVINRGK